MASDFSLQLAGDATVGDWGEGALRMLRRAGGAAPSGLNSSFLAIADSVLSLGASQQNYVFKQELLNQEFMRHQFIIGTTAIVSTSLTVGYAVWLLRGGTLIGSCLSATPAWCSFDPLPIVESFAEANSKRKRTDDDESLTSIASPCA